MGTRRAAPKCFSLLISLQHLLCVLTLFNDCLFHDLVCFQRANSCLRVYLYPCCLPQGLVHNTQFMFAGSVFKWMNEWKVSEREADCRGWILIACFLSASLSDILTRTHLGGFEFLCFCSFWSLVQSSDIGAWKSFQNQGQRKTFLHTRFSLPFPVPLTPASTGMNQAHPKAIPQVTFMISVLWNYFIIYLILDCMWKQ